MATTTDDLYIITEHNAVTGETVTRPMTDDERAQHDVYIAAVAASDNA